MTGDPFIREGKLWIVPIIRQRLNFTVLVRRAFHALEPWTSEDAVAVALPRFVGRKMVGLLRDVQDRSVLPVRLIVASWGETDYREVFPVTPADGLVEAVRSATENGLPLNFVDRDIRPGNLVNRTCLSDAEFPDDGLVCMRGAHHYLSLIAPQLAEPPSRFDPVDTWREAHIAEQLKHLIPRHGRILLVCEAVHVPAIRRLVRQPGETFGDPELLLPDDGPKLRVLRPNLEAMLRYLDDYPHLVEQYEVRRYEGRAHEFDKTAELYRVVHGSVRQHTERGASTRRFASFRRYLSSLLHSGQRITPRPADLQVALVGCFGTASAERLRHQLVTYGGEIDFRRVGTTLEAREPVYALRQQGRAANFVSRSCSSQPKYSVLPPWPIVDGNAGDMKSYSLDLEPDARIRRRVAAVLRTSDIRTKTEAFRGSLESGIDARRTLRSFLTPQPEIYVRRATRRHKHPDVKNEPLVWILTLSTRDARAFQIGFRCGTVVGSDPNVWFSQRSSFFVNERELYRAPDGKVVIAEERALGGVSYFPGTMEVEALRKLFGERFAARVPVHDEFDAYTSKGCLPRSIAPYASSSTWWELALLAGLQYAENAVICVAPDEFRVSELVSRHARALKKQILFVQLSQLHREDRAALGVSHCVRLPSALDTQDDRNKQFMRRLRELIVSLGIWKAEDLRR